MFRDQFTDFTFNDISSKSMKVWITNSRDLQDQLVPSSSDTFITQTTIDGRIYAGSTITSQTITLKCAAIEITDKERRNISQWLNPKATGALIFGFDPYHYYDVKVSGEITADRWVRGRYHKELGGYTYIYNFTIKFTTVGDWTKLGVPVHLDLTKTGTNTTPLKVIDENSYTKEYWLNDYSNLYNSFVLPFVMKPSNFYTFLSNESYESSYTPYAYHVLTDLLPEINNGIYGDYICTQATKIFDSSLQAPSGATPIAAEDYSYSLRRCLVVSIKAKVTEVQYKLIQVINGSSQTEEGSASISNLTFQLLLNEECDSYKVFTSVDEGDSYTETSTDNIQLHYSIELKVKGYSNIMYQIRELKELSDSSYTQRNSVSLSSNTVTDNIYSFRILITKDYLPYFHLKFYGYNGEEKTPTSSSSVVTIEKLLGTNLVSRNGVDAHNYYVICNPGLEPMYINLNSFTSSSGTLNLYTKLDGNIITNIDITYAVSYLNYVTDSYVGISTLNGIVPSLFVSYDDDQDMLGIDEETYVNNGIFSIPSGNAETIRLNQPITLKTSAKIGNTFIPPRIELENPDFILQHYGLCTISFFNRLPNNKQRFSVLSGDQTIEPNIENIKTFTGYVLARGDLNIGTSDDKAQNSLNENTTHVIYLNYANTETDTETNTETKTETDDELKTETFAYQYMSICDAHILELSLGEPRDDGINPIISLQTRGN